MTCVPPERAFKSATSLPDPTHDCPATLNSKHTSSIHVSDVISHQTASPDMAEAIAALSLAANILQMVEYGGFFVTTAWKIYSSPADTHLAKDFDHLRYLTEDVDKILGSLEQNDLDTTSAAGLRDRDRDLLALIAESRKITEEILDSLNKIGNPTAWRSKKRKAIQAAFKSTWKSDRIADLQTKLDRIRSQLTLHLVHSLRYVGINLWMYLRHTHSGWHI